MSIDFPGLLEQTIYSETTPIDKEVTWTFQRFMKANTGVSANPPPIWIPVLSVVWAVGVATDHYTICPEYS